MRITPDGKKNIEQKLSELHDRLTALEKEKANAYTATGDTWHDNPYFDMLRRDEESLVKEIKGLEKILHEAEVIEKTDDCENTVNIGSKIKCVIQYSFDDETEEEILEIVGHGEADPAKGKIAYDSPVGENLMGHVQGDTISFQIPAGVASYKIVCFYSDDEKKEIEEK